MHIFVHKAVDNFISCFSTCIVINNLFFTYTLEKKSVETKNCNFILVDRSTKSEKMYPTMFSRGPDVEVEPYYCLPVGTMQNTITGHPNAGLVGKTTVPWSQPTSPTPPNRFSNGPLSPTHTTYRLTYPKKNDDSKFSFKNKFNSSFSWF